MELTGKCKEEFEKYRCLHYHETENEASHSGEIIWNYVSDSMQYGVYVDYFDSVDIRITINAGRSHFWADIYIDLSKDLSWDSKMIDTRKETKDLAIEKANELRNEVLNKPVSGYGITYGMAGGYFSKAEGNQLK